MKRELMFGFSLIFVACSLLEYLEHALVLAPIYATMKELVRPSEETITWLVIVSYAVYAFFFTLIFSKWYKGTGLVEGVQYGVYVALFTSFPYAYLAYASTPIPHSLALQRVIYGIIENVAYGVIAAWVYGKSNRRVS